MKRLIPLLLLGILVGACAPPQQDVPQVRATIEELNQKMAKDLMAGIIDTSLANYTEDCYSMPNGEPMLKGKQAIREHTAQMLKTGMKFTDVKFTTLDVQVSGSFAFEVGKYAMTMQIPGLGEISDNGKYLTVYERAKDGAWKIKAETWNTDSTPSMQPPAQTGS